MAIPVYMFAGFLESGKTSFIASVLQDPGFTRDENTLIIQCEEGETEYEPDMLKKTHSVVECIEDEDEYNGDTLRAFVRKHHPDRVIVEMNGMWDLDAAIERTPKVLEIYQIITTVNAETFDLYAKNMGQRMLQHITDADMVVFNRATEETRQLIRDRNVRRRHERGLRRGDAAALRHGRADRRDRGSSVRHLLSGRFREPGGIRRKDRAV